MEWDIMESASAQAVCGAHININCIKEECLDSQDDHILETSVKCDLERCDMAAYTSSSFHTGASLELGRLEEDCGLVVKSEPLSDQDVGLKEEDDTDTEEDIETSGDESDDPQDEDYDYKADVASADPRELYEDDYGVEFECNNCDKCFQCQEHLTEHVALCHRTKVEYSSGEEGQVKSEFETRNGDTCKNFDPKKLQCLQCGGYFKKLKAHQKKVHSNMLYKFVCPATKCDYTSAVLYNVKLHVRRRHRRDMTEEKRLQFLRLKAKRVEKKLMPNVTNPRIPGSQKRFMCPVDGCRIKCDRKRDIKSHLVNKHRQYLSPEDFHTMANYGIPCEFVTNDSKKQTESTTQTAKSQGTSQGQNDQESVRLTPAAKKRTSKASLPETNARDFRVRKKIRYKRQAQCPDCDWQYYGTHYKQSLQSHQQSVHSPTVEKFACPVPDCGYLEFQKRKIAPHVVVKHGRVLTPEELKYYTQRHIIATKTIENPRYLPPRHRTQSIKQEIISDAEERQSADDDNDDDLKVTQCKKCNKYFYGPKCKVLLGQHCKENHVEKVKFYICPLPVCKYKGSRSDYLKNHLRTHLKRKEISLEAFKVHANPKNYLSKHLIPDPKT